MALIVENIITFLKSPYENVGDFSSKENEGRL